MVAPHTRLGPYEVLSPLGAGGMGEVWRARDTRLGREVALKLLPESVATDEARLSRFEREAKLLASLNHPGVATLYGFETVDGRPVLVLEVVEGPTLADRLDRGALPWQEALQVALHIAEALEAAHEKGIVHRDLKPSNIKLSEDGRVKLLDFGLGKALGAKSVASEVKLSTETSPTDVGVILGTAPYMSPEQARGESVDHRSDIWAFGCVLYEMLTGKRAFPGPTASDVVAAILDREPDWAALPYDTPPLVRSLLRRCLTKDPFRRLHAIADARIELEEALTVPSMETRPSRATASRRWLPIGAAVTLALAAAAATAWRWTRVAPATRHAPTRFNIAIAGGTELQTADAGWPMIALSPDGRHLIYQAWPAGSRRTSRSSSVVMQPGGLYIRSLDRVEAHVLHGAERGSHPFFSPDGRWVGFWAGGNLQKVSVDDGSPRVIAAASDASGASWGEDGTIVYTPDSSAGLHRISAEGGTPQKLTQPDGEIERGHQWPQILPGGQAVIFTIYPPSGRVQDSRIAVLSLETGRRKVIVEGGTYGRYLATGHLLYASGGTVFAAPFDLRRLELTGPAIPVLENVRMDAFSGLGGVQLAFSHTGVLAYVTPHMRPRETQLLWIDRKGSAEPLSTARRAFTDPVLSPDGRRLIVSIDEPDGATNLWLHDRDRQTWTQMTFEKNNWLAQWSPGGDQLAFASNREGYQNLFVMPSDGGVPARLTNSRHTQLATGWSPDGRVVLFAEQDPATFWDVWEVPVVGDRNPRPLFVAQGYQGGGRLSPDGRWLAYRSSETGRAEVYVRPYRGLGQKWTISTDGGRLPRWSRTGREIFYISERSGSYKIWAVPVTMAPTFRPGSARVLFERGRDIYTNYDVTADGQHFVVAEDAEAQPELLQIVVIPDWFEELKAKVPVPR